jgi:Ca2+-binding EF-hand superfamily protein
MRSRLILAVAALSAYAVVAQAQTAAPATAATPAADGVAAAFKRVDADGNGKLSKEEAARLPAIADKFDTLDKDKDGALSAEEFSAAAAPKQ